jgi:tRNA pseudouridine38-40 synthase
MWNHSEQALVQALNAKLPADLRAGGARRVPDSFHARHSARARRYQYRVWQGGSADAVVGRWQHRVAQPLVDSWMAEAAAAFLGVHDFGAFGAAVTASGTTVRRIERFDVVRSGPQLVLEVVANAFLRHQVRRMVAAVLEVGRGRTTVASLTQALLGAPDAPRFGRVPAQGLTLVDVEYAGPAWPDPTQPLENMKP